MTVQEKADRYVEAGMSLWRAIQWIYRTFLRQSDPVLGWRAVFRETRAKHGHCWNT